MNRWPVESIALTVAVILAFVAGWLEGREISDCREVVYLAESGAVTCEPGTKAEAGDGVVVCRCGP